LEREREKDKINAGSSFFVISIYAWASFDCLINGAESNLLKYAHMEKSNMMMKFAFPSTSISDDRSEIKDGENKTYLRGKMTQRNTLFLLPICLD
jgi:hypothetical protein